MPKPSLAYLVSADQVIVDESSKKYSYIGVFYKVFIDQGMEFVNVDFSIVGRMMDLPIGPVEMSVEILNPDDTVLSSAQLTGTITELGAVDVHARFNDVTFKKEGIYTYHLRYLDKIIGANNSQKLVVEKR